MAALLWLAIWLPSAAAQAPTGALLIGPARAEEPLTAIAEGHGAWLQQRLASAGVNTIDAAGGESPETWTGISALLDRAADRGVAYAIVPELRASNGQASIRLAVFSVASGELLAAPLATATVAQVGEACEASAVELMVQLGVPRHSIVAAAPPQLDELAVASRALQYRDAGDLARAWRAVEGKLTPLPMALREALVETARRPETPVVQRARVLAASGDGRAAWRLLAPELEKSGTGGSVERELLLAAAEAQLARNNPRAARPHLDALLARHPRDAEGQYQLARVFELQNNPEGARRALLLSAQASPDDPRAHLRLATLLEGDPKRQAQHLLAAGQRAARHYSPHRAERLLERAAALDPATAQEAWRSRASLRASLGEPAEALAAYEEIVESGGADAEVWTGIGRAQRALEDPGAEKSFRRALVLNEQAPGALTDLGVMYLDYGRAQSAVPLLERAIESDPANRRARRHLARALHARGESERAVELLANRGVDAEGGVDAKGLAQLAAIRRERGDLEGARDAIARAIELDPLDMALQEELALVHTATGDSAKAAAARERAALLAGTETEEIEEDTQGDVLASFSFDDLVLSFSSQVPDARHRQVSLLGVREPETWLIRLLQWIAPRAPDFDGIELALKQALDRGFTRVDAVGLDHPALRNDVERLFDFESPDSLGANTIADVNHALDTDAIFVSRLRRRASANADEDDAAAACHAVDGYMLEVRMLHGRHADVASILTADKCLQGGAESWGVWNRRTAAVGAALGLFLLLPLLRGWGTVVVLIELPPRTKGFFRIRIGKKPDQVRDEVAEQKKRDMTSGRLRRSLRSLSRFEKHMVGRRTAFRWIPARARAYYVTVRGPLFDAKGDKAIGHFLEEQRARIARGKVVTLEYDFCPSECAVEVTVLFGGKPANGAQIAVSGDPTSMRYARDGKAFQYLEKGVHTILVGVNDRAAEREIEITSFENAIPLSFELSDEVGLVFQGCPTAVDAFLQGDYGACAEALAAAGQSDTAHRLRGALFRDLGDTDRAAAEFEAAGHLEEAAELRASGSDVSESAALFERAGNFARAADTYRAAGEFENAARCYEAAYDFTNAIECYVEAGNAEKEIDLLQKTGAYLDAATRAVEHGDPNAAMRNIQEIDARDPSYGEACRLMADILSARGDDELAAEKLAEAIEAAGGDRAPIEIHERHAELLARAGQKEQALAAYESVRRRDPRRDGVIQHIETLRRDVDAAGATVAAPSPSPQSESRYELLGEIGRGGMGVVFKARDKRLGRIVALKRLPENLRDHKVAAQLFLREAQAAAALNHRNIVTVYDAGEENGIYCITMELLEGVPLSTILEKRGRLSPKDTVRLGLQIAAGLHYAHQQRIIHRDIKTANLFFTRERVVKIMDFGLAKTIEEVRRSSTVIGGTPYYMAPEQAVGEAVDNRTDLYAFGVTLFRMVAGELPFREGDLAYHHRHTPPPDPRSIESDVPPAMAELILSLLSKDPDGRPETAAAVARSLQKILQNG